MLTKKDLAAIEIIVGAVVSSSVDSAESRIIKTLRNEMSQNTQELIELITTGFNISQDHEVQISRIEKKVFHNAI
jgi:hypothetical protein